MWRHVAVQNLSPFMLDDEEAVQDAKRQGGHSEKIASGKDLTVILQECQPLLIGISAAHDVPQIAGDGPLGDSEIELLQCGVDLGGAPPRILFGQASNQIP